MTDCIFCKIIEGELPSFKIYDDHLVKVFLSQNAAITGHLIIAPKKHYENVFDVPEETIAHVNVIAKKMAILLRERLRATGVNILNASGKSAQQNIFHFHYHVIPRFENDGLDLWIHGIPSEQDVLETVYRKLV